MVPILEHEGSAGPGQGDNRRLEGTLPGVRDGHYKTSFCMVWCRTYGTLVREGAQFFYALSSSPDQLEVVLGT